MKILILLASVTCTDLGGGFTQCYDDDPDPGDGKYSTCYWLDDQTQVCEDQQNLSPLIGAFF